jgi:hypothetical protein
MSPGHPSYGRTDPPDYGGKVKEPSTTSTDEMRRSIAFMLDQLGMAVPNMGAGELAATKHMLQAILKEEAAAQREELKRFTDLLLRAIHDPADEDDLLDEQLMRFMIRSRPSIRAILENLQAVGWPPTACEQEETE